MSSLARRLGGCLRSPFFSRFRRRVATSAVATVIVSVAVVCSRDIFSAVSLFLTGAAVATAILRVTALVVINMLVVAAIVVVVIVIVPIGNIDTVTASSDRGSCGSCRAKRSSCSQCGASGTTSSNCCTRNTSAGSRGRGGFRACATAVAAL